MSPIMNHTGGFFMANAYTAHLALKFQDDWWRLSDTLRREYAADVVNLFDRFESRITLRGVYVTQGFRADTDIFLWMYGDNIEDIQDLQLALRRSELGKRVSTPWAFIGLSQPAEFSQDHRPSFLNGVSAKKFLCFYPYIRTADWYLLPKNERGVMLKEHGDFGREYPGILTNGVYNFGLGDFEWLLTFEVDHLEVISQAIRHMRETEARRYTKYEWPFIVGRRFGLAQALAQYQ